MANELVSLIVVMLSIIRSIVSSSSVLVSLMRRIFVVNVVAEGGLSVAHFQRIGPQLNQLWDLLHGAREIDGILQKVVLFQVGAEDDVLLILAVMVDLGLGGFVVVVIGQGRVGVVDAVVVPAVRVVVRESVGLVIRAVVVIVVMMLI